jgi:hypothetical protein
LVAVGVDAVVGFLVGVVGVDRAGERLRFRIICAVDEVAKQIKIPYDVVGVEVLYFPIGK